MAVRKDVGAFLDDGLGRDAVGLVVGVLDAAAAFGFGHGFGHAVGDLVRVEDGFAVDVSGGSADGLD